MKKVMKSTTVLVVLATIIFTILYRTMENGVLLSLAITAGTISYDFQSCYAQSGKSVSKMVSAEKMGKEIIPEATCKAMEK